MEEDALGGEEDRTEPRLRENIVSTEYQAGGAIFVLETYLAASGIRRREDGVEKEPERFQRFDK